jgi:hypothetical protein
LQQHERITTLRDIRKKGDARKHGLFTLLKSYVA